MTASLVQTAATAPGSDFFDKLQVSFLFTLRQSKHLHCQQMCNRLSSSPCSTNVRHRNSPSASPNTQRRRQPQDTSIFCHRHWAFPAGSSQFIELWHHHRRQEYTCIEHSLGVFGLARRMRFLAPASACNYSALSVLRFAFDKISFPSFVHIRNSHSHHSQHTLLFFEGDILILSLEIPMQT